MVPLWNFCCGPRIHDLFLWQDPSNFFGALKNSQDGCHFADIFKSIFMNHNYTLILISLKFVPTGRLNRQEVIIGSVNGLAPVRCQAITWTNDYRAHCKIYASPSLNELRVYFITQDLAFPNLSLNTNLCLCLSVNEYILITWELLRHNTSTQTWKQNSFEDVLC